MIPILYVALGGAIGSVARYLLGGAVSRWMGSDFPYGTLTANVMGSLLMGILIGWLAKQGNSEAMRLLLAVGVLGGFTTFSAFSLDIVSLYERGAVSAALIYILASILLSVLGLFAGLALMRGVSL